MAKSILTLFAAALVFSFGFDGTASAAQTAGHRPNTGADALLLRAQVRRVCHPQRSPCEKGYVYECDRCVKG